MLEESQRQAPTTVHTCIEGTPPQQHHCRLPGYPLAAAALAATAAAPLPRPHRPAGCACPRLLQHVRGLAAAVLRHPAAIAPPKHTDKTCSSNRHSSTNRSTHTHSMHPQLTPRCPRGCQQHSLSMTGKLSTAPSLCHTHAAELCQAACLLGAHHDPSQQPT